ncbi:MAG: hypothetical protein SPH94_00075 [Fusobacterium necrophorum]|uniref:DUF6162 family protein n=1 Tax=Fusobacterium necrophorum TaxID=859 RepID=UPI000D12B44F|nr:hypothetical protein [Fusobacterium necrophorum]AVQ21200.1 hypothetical protein C4N15_05910 [Fusobacterium necrophorum subsp. funduliforme]MCI7343955.1 hypothetical protein [Fusobacterium necrophorum]MDY2574054.1 hypothetical protein [Fusobacterium necrophorum]MDY6171578.1 hypothetical protein [Fusobacterium necrophorum]
MRKINSVKIHPLSSKKENLFLSLVVIAIVIIAYFLIQLTAKKDIGQTLTATQISAYRELSNVNNSFYTELTNSLLEIEALTEAEGEIPEIAVLEEEEISPYLKDDLWEERGALTWQKLEVKGKVYYLGISKQVNIVGNYLIEFNREEMDKSIIYYNDEQDDGRSLPKSISHLQEHWREIVPYTGAEERKKF